MADACGISYDILAWTSEWYVREETLRAANLAIIGHHQRMPLAAVFGAGTLSSSDGQRFPVRGKTTTGREMTIHGGQVLSTHTHVTEQHTTYGTKIIVATKREAHYVLDEILGNATNVPSPSTPPTPTASPWSTSACSTCWACSSRPGSGTWARSPCTGSPGRPAPRLATRTSGHCSPGG
jgi:hypothetical protein